MNVIVALPLNCLLKLLAVDRLKATLPPVPKSLNVSLNVVEVICVVAVTAPVTFTSPV